MVKNEVVKSTIIMLVDLHRWLKLERIAGDEDDYNKDDKPNSTGSNRFCAPLFAVREFLQNWYDAMISVAWDYVRTTDKTTLKHWSNGAHYHL